MAQPATHRAAARRAELAGKVRELFDASGGTDGSPRITVDLRAAGWRVSENTVAKLMAEPGLAGRRPKRLRHLTKQASEVAVARDLSKPIVPLRLDGKPIFDLDDLHYEAVMDASTSRRVRMSASGVGDPRPLGRNEPMRRSARSTIVSLPRASGRNLRCGPTGRVGDVFWTACVMRASAGSSGAGSDLADFPGRGPS